MMGQGPALPQQHYRKAFNLKDYVNLRLFDRIWHISGSLTLTSNQSSNEAFDKLEPLFHQTGTSHDRTGNRLTFRKKNPAAQDKMSIFDDGVLQITNDVGGSVLHYRLSSRALLYCFLAPLLFLAFAQVTITLGKFEAASAEASSSKEDKKKDIVLTLHPIDKALGAPAPEKPKDKDKDKDDNGHSPTAAYFLAVIFATLYVVGRIIEDFFFKRLMKRKLSEPGNPI